jgi:hypothetical protein
MLAIFMRLAFRRACHCDINRRLPLGHRMAGTLRGASPLFGRTRPDTSFRAESYTASVDFATVVEQAARGHNRP